MTSAVKAGSVGAVVRELLSSRYRVDVEITDDQDLYELLELDVADRLETFRGLLEERFPRVPIPEVLTIQAIQRAASSGDDVVHRLSAKATAALPRAVAQAIVRTRAELSAHFQEDDYDAFDDPESFAFDPATFAHAIRDAIASVAELADPAALTRSARNERVQFALAKNRQLPLNALVAEVVALFRLSVSDGKVMIPGPRFDSFHDDLATTIERFVADGDADAETLGTVCATAIKALVATLSRDSSPELQALHDQTRSALAEELVPKLRRTERRAAEIVKLVDTHCSFVRAAEVVVPGEVVKYSPKKRFVAGQKITHPKFGAGDVVSVTSTSMKVRFGEVEKMLVHGR